MVPYVSSLQTSRPVRRLVHLSFIGRAWLIGVAYGFKKPPRVIIALAKHRKDADKWTAHRFDLSSGNLTSYAVTSDEPNLPDALPFMCKLAFCPAEGCVGIS